MPLHMPFLSPGNRSSPHLTIILALSYLLFILQLADPWSNFLGILLNLWPMEVTNLYSTHHTVSCHSIRCCPHWTLSSLKTERLPDSVPGPKYLYSRHSTNFIDEEVGKEGPYTQPKFLPLCDGRFRTGDFHLWA